MSKPLEIVRVAVPPEIYLRLSIGIASARDPITIANAALQNVGVEFYPEYSLDKWTGTGLPPVGTVCEVMHCEEWTKCHVIAHFDQRCGPVAAYTVDIGHGAKQLDACIADQFRPLRTPEQIAAEEREKAIGEMLMAVNPVGHMPKYTIELIRCLYDAGYRKTTE